MRSKADIDPQRRRKNLATYAMAIPPAALAPPTKPVTSGAVPGMPAAMEPVHILMSEG